MSNLDEVKEILKILRLAITVSFGMLVFTAGAIIKRYDNNIDPDPDPVFFGLV